MKYIYQNSFLKKLIILTLSIGVFIFIGILVFNSFLKEDVQNTTPVSVQEVKITDFSQDFTSLGLSLDSYGGIAYYSPSGENFIFTGENKRKDFEYDIWTALYDFKSGSASIIRKDFIYGSPAWNRYGFVFSAKEGLYYYSYLEKSVSKIVEGDLSYSPLVYDYDNGKSFISTQLGIKIIGNSGQVYEDITDVPYDRPLFYDKDKNILFFSRENTERSENSDPDQTLISLDLSDMTEDILFTEPDFKIISVKWADTKDDLYLRYRKSIDVKHSIFNIDTKKNTIVGAGATSVDYWDGNFLVSNNCIGQFVSPQGVLLQEYTLESEGTCDDIRLLPGGEIIYKYKNHSNSEYFVKTFDIKKSSYEELYKSLIYEGSFILSSDRYSIAIPKETEDAFLFFGQ